jgi:hypothetical protein
MQIKTPLKFWAAGIAQVVEYLPSKHKGLTQTPVLPKQTNKQTKMLCSDFTSFQSEWLSTRK